MLGGGRLRAVWPTAKADLVGEDELLSHNEKAWRHFYRGLEAGTTENILYSWRQCASRLRV